MKVAPLLLPIAAAASLISSAVADITVKFTSDKSQNAIPGESVTKGHTGEISAVSFKAGVFQQGQQYAKGAGAGASKSEFRPISVFKYIDKASPNLFLACAIGTRYTSATLTVSAEATTGFAAAPERPTGDYFRFVLSDVFVTSVNQDADATDSSGNLVETIELTYSKIMWYYKSASGEEVSGGFDLVKNKPITVAPAP